MTPWLRWSVASTISLVVHVLAGIGLAALFDPLPVPQQTQKPGGFELATLEVVRRDASEQNAESEMAAQLAPRTASATGQSVPRRRVHSVSGPSAVVELGALIDVSPPVIAGSTLGPSLVPSALAAGTLRSNLVESAPLSPAAVFATAADQSDLNLVRIEVLEAPATANRVVAGVVTDAAQFVPTDRVEGPLVRPAPFLAEESLPARLSAPVLAPVAGSPAVAVSGDASPLRLENWEGIKAPVLVAFVPPAHSAKATTSIAAQVPSVGSQGTRLQPGLEWSGAGQVQLDADSLTALQVFMRPELTEADGGMSVRDRIAEAMAGPRCARVQTVFDPKTGALELRGHVPNQEARQPLIEALRSNVGNALEIMDNLRLLPPPQCGILDGMAGLGLPQSEEQLTDPHLIGENAQVREYQYQEYDRLVIDLTAPDYDAYIYVDYFDAEGQVIHLVPNAQTPLRRYQAKSQFSIGQADPSGAPNLEMRIGPPFGQDIAVAIASDRQLYAEPRPVIEPAEPYLGFLQERVAALSRQGETFRGEWVYLFVATSPKSN